MIMSHDRSQFDSLNDTERGVVNLMWLTLVRPCVVRAYEENVPSLHMVRACKDHRDENFKSFLYAHHFHQ
jgi:hypothetical protein